MAVFQLLFSLLLMSCLAWGSLSHASSKAVVVAVSHYPNIERRDLEGPVNDATLMLASLRRLGLEKSDITLLSESPQADAMPTRANILSSITQAAGRVRPGEWLVIYLSGHGTQQPQTRPKNGYIEPDGLDEVFLPRDTARWLPEKRIIEGALSDDDIGLALGRVTARGINVWTIFDTCHAGDMAKNHVFDPDGPVIRYVSPFKLGVPVSLFAQRSSAIPQRSHLAVLIKNKAGASKTPPGQLITFYAAGPDEPAAEELLPNPDAPDKPRRYGVFTYALNQQIRSWSGSYRELADGIQAFYKTRPFPTPQFGGAMQAVPNFGFASNPPDKSVRSTSWVRPSESN